MTLLQLETPQEAESDRPVEFPPLAVLYKHSPACSISSRAILEVQAFADDHPDVPVLMVDVLGQQSLSRQLASQLGVHHESPQVIVLKNGQPKWHRSGIRIRLDALEYAVESAAG